MSTPLPLLAGAPHERRDAARNREALLAAAVDLVADCGVDAVTMEAVAARAGVGKGTVFRRFESRAGLMVALLDFSEREWQTAVLSGPPPLGPGAPPLDRLLAFGRSRIEATLRQRQLIGAAGGRVRTSGAFGFLLMHVRLLLAEIGVQGDLPLLASNLLAPLDLPVLEDLVVGQGLSVDRVYDAWADLVRRVVRD